MALSDYVNLGVYEDWADSLLLDELIASPAEDFAILWKAVKLRIMSST